MIFSRDIEEPVKRVIVMVILNASIGFFLKVLTAYAPIFDLKNISSLGFDDFKRNIYNRSIFCLDYPSCHLIERIADFLNLIPLYILLFFYWNFDKKFKAALKLFVLRFFCKK